ncbi:TPA: hypothetical protein DEF17_08125 [bacterium]|nr:hypothetical protein [bacterium]
MKRIIYLSAVAVAAIQITSCAAFPTAEDSSTTSDYTSAEYLPPLQTAPELRIKDLPVPAGYLYKADRSMLIEYGNVIAGIINYEGSVDAGELIGFYRREMPKYDWNLTSMIEREEVKMIFQKEGKICEIILKSVGGLSKKSAISIYYAPKE